MPDTIAPAVVLDLPTSAPAAIEAPPPADGQAVVTSVKEPVDESPVDLATWAKTNAANRKMRAELADLKTKLEAASKTVDPEAAAIEALKKPGIKAMLEKAGYSFEKLVEEYAGGEEPPTDPRVDDVQKRLDAIEAQRKADDEARAAQTAAERKAEMDRYEAAAHAGIVELVKQKNVDVADEKDPRFGTPRWELLRDDTAAYQTAHKEVLAYCQKRRDKDPKFFVTNEQVESLLSQALDQLELHERERLSPKLDKLRKSPAIVKGSDPITSRTQPRSIDRPNVTPKTIDQSAIRGPKPTESRKRFEAVPGSRVSVRGS